MGGAFDDPLASTLEAFANNKKYWEGGAEEQEEQNSARESHRLARAKAHALGRQALAPAQFMNRADVWGGGLRRMVEGGVGPRREDEHYYAPRYVPVGFARYVDPTVDPANYTYYRLSGWRVAVPLTLPGPAARALLLRIYRYGPASVGYARLGDTLVPAILGPGDRQTLAQTSTRSGSAARKYPLA
jgi:hypothetical protein